MDVKWIKLMTDMFDNRKIRYLRKLPDGNSIVLIWVMLLSLAGRCNAGGMIHLTRDIPYTPKMLADELDFEENTVTLALKALENLGMISLDPLVITNWEEYQSTEKLDQIREQNRLRKQKQRALEAASRDSHVTVTQDVTQCHATDIDIERELETEVEGDKENISNLSLSERKKEKRKKEDADSQSDPAEKTDPAPDASPVFRSVLEREYKKLSPDLRQRMKETYGEYMDVIRGYLAKKPGMTQAEAENVCRMLDWLYHGDVESWIGMLKCRGGQE
jgi:predicted phage replisome organizer